MSTTKHNLKRATVEILAVYAPASDSILTSQITRFKIELEKEKKRVPQTAISEMRIAQYKKEIHNFRKRLQAHNPTGYRFGVYVKKLKAYIEVDYDFYPDGRPKQEEPKKKDTRPPKKPFAKMIDDVINRAISRAREKFVAVPQLGKFATGNAEFWGKKKQGRVFAKEGQILKLYIDRNLQALYADKKPETQKKYIGIELEFCAPIKKNMFSIKLFKAGVHKFAQLKTDGSLRPHLGEEGYELAVLLEENNYKKSLKQITDLLKEVGAKVEDRRCGLHVHVDMRKRNKDVVYNNLVACQYALLSIVDPQRYNNEFCKTVDSRTMPTEFTGDRQERYKTINAAAYYKYKTLEVRMHEGSIEFDQISHWVDLLVKIANYPKKFKTDVTKVSILQRRLNLNKKLFEYAVNRSCTWQVQNTGFAQELRADMPVTDTRAGREFEDTMARIRNNFTIPTGPTEAFFRGQVGADVAAPPQGTMAIPVRDNRAGVPAWTVPNDAPAELADAVFRTGLGLNAFPAEFIIDEQIDAVIMEEEE